MHDTTQEEIPMTKEEFQKLTQNVVLLDGATGSNLMAAGMPRGICTEICQLPVTWQMRKS